MTAYIFNWRIYDLHNYIISFPDSLYGDIWLDQTKWLMMDLSGGIDFITSKEPLKNDLTSTWSMFMVTDRNGKKSRTLFFVTISWAVLVFKFAIAGLGYGEITAPEMSASEFGMAVAGILAIWLGREWKETHYEK